MKKRTNGQWIKYLDRLFSEVIKQGGKCERCGRVCKKLDTSHVFSRSNKEVRWDVKNAFCACSGCHFWWHKNPPEAAEFYKMFIGEDEYEKLRFRARQTRQWHEAEYLKVEQELNLCKKKDQSIPF